MTPPPFRSWLLARLLPLGAASSLLAGCVRTEAPPFSHAAAIDSLGAWALAEGPIAGLSIAVAEGGRLVFEWGYGVESLESGAPATGATVYNIASTAKIMAAAGVVRLVDAGLLSLDDTLAPLLPDVSDIEATHDITLRQLLNMTSGLNDYVAADVRRLETSRAPLTPSFVLDHARTHPLDVEPGSSWIYTNTGFYLAGLIVERMSGRRWGEYIIDDVARPLGLNETWLCDDVADVRATGYQRSDDGFELSALDAERGVRGDAGLCATVGDLARLPAALERGNVISSAGLSAMLAPTQLGPGLTVDYGLGISRGTMGGHRLWGHLGGSGSIVSALAHYPDEDVTIAVLVNTRGGSLGALALEGKIAEIVLGLIPQLEDRAVDPALGADLEGTYVGDRGPSTFVVVREGDRLTRLSADDPGSQLELLLQDGRTFGRADWPHDRFVFQPREGRAEGYAVYYNGFFDGFYRRMER